MFAKTRAINKNISHARHILLFSVVKHITLLYKQYVLKVIILLYKHNLNGTYSSTPKNERKTQNNAFLSNVVNFIHFRITLKKSSLFTHVE